MKVENISLVTKYIKASHCEKLLHISFDNVYGYFEKDGRTGYLSSKSIDEKYQKMFENIKYLIQQKSNIPDVYYYGSIKITINSDDDLPLQKM